MQTYTHLVITEFLNRKLKSWENAGQTTVLASGDYEVPPVAPVATRVGSMAPDAPLTLAFLAFLAMDMIAKQSDEQQLDTDEGEERHRQSRVGHLFGTLFFKDWRMKLVHNLFHAPLLTLTYTLIGYWGWRRQKKWGSTLFWFGASCTLHTAIDIPLHYDDGPLLLFPFDWQTRYYSPVSYWDSKRYGRQFMVFEHLLLIGLIIWLVRDWWLDRDWWTSRKI